MLGRQLGIGAAVHHARQRLVQDPPERVRALGDGHSVQLRFDALAHPFDAALLYESLGRLVVEQHQVDPLVLQILDRMLDIRVRIQITRRHLFGVNQRILHEGSYTEPLCTPTRCAANCSGWVIDVMADCAFASAAPTPV